MPEEQVTQSSWSRAASAMALHGAVSRMLQILEVHFHGYVIGESEAANQLYLMLRELAGRFAAEFPPVQSALEEFTSVFPNLYEAVDDPDYPEANWEYSAQWVKPLKARLSEALFEVGATPAAKVPDKCSRLFETVDDVIAKLSRAKAELDRDWLKSVQKAASTIKPFEWARTGAQPSAPVGRGDKSLHDEAHAAAVEGLIAYLRSQGKEPQPEGTYSWYGERGSVDVFCVEGPHEAPLGLAVYELWTEIGNLNEALRKLDQKARVFPQHLSKEFGMGRPALIQAHMVLLATDANADLLVSYVRTFQGKFREGIKAGTRFVLSSFDPVAGVLTHILPPSGSDQPAQPLRRFADKKSFLNAWRKRRRSVPPHE